MYMGRRVRFFGVFGPRNFKLRYWWPELSYQYAMSFAQAFKGIARAAWALGGQLIESPSMRVVPIGAVSITDDSLRAPGFQHWKHLVDAGVFQGSFASSFVNVVCAPPGLPMGWRITGQELAPTKVVGCQGGEVDPAVLRAGHGASSESVYRPDTALYGLYTIGVPNIAITSAHQSLADGKVVEAALTEQEENALRSKYDLVVVPHYDDQLLLSHWGIESVCFAPIDFTAEILSLQPIKEVFGL